MISDYVIVGAIGGIMIILCIVATVIGIKAPKQEFKKLSKKENYNRYMKSDEWQLQRLKALKKSKYKCSKCGSKKNLQLHHLTYAHFGNELSGEVKILCRKCHQKAHGRRF